jgi:hypothetical protein
MKLVAVLLISLLSGSAACGQARADSGLDALGQQLAAYRAMPVDDPSPTPEPCPSDDLLDTYMGLDQQELYRRLGRPDWVNPQTLRHWYGLTHPISSNWRGGGYCSIGFLFDNKGAVQNVSVSIAQ